MSKERIVTVAEVKELLTSEYERRRKLEEQKAEKPAVEYKPAVNENGEPVVEEDTTFKQVQKEALAHAETTSKLSKEDANKLVKELEGLSFTEPAMTDAMKNGTVACKIADFLPKYPEDIRAIFYKERLKLEADDIAKIIDTVKKYQ